MDQKVKNLSLLVLWKSYRILEKIVLQHIEEKLKILANLGDSTLDEIKNEGDFWMSDRAGDNETFRESIPETKILNAVLI